MRMEDEDGGLGGGWRCGCSGDRVNRMGKEVEGCPQDSEVKSRGSKMAPGDGAGHASIFIKDLREARTVPPALTAQNSCTRYSDEGVLTHTS